MFKQKIRCTQCSEKWYEDGNTVPNGTKSQTKCKSCGAYGSVIDNEYEQ